MGELSDLPNISNVLESKLNQAGIYTKKDLSELGSKEAFLRMKMYDSEACINSFYALEGAVEGIRWHSLSDEKKKELKEFFESL